jgi:tetratricopeptide (TPR) repeat protein
MYLPCLKGSLEAGENNHTLALELFKEAEEQGLKHKEHTNTYFFVELYREWATVLERLDMFAEALEIYKKYQTMREQHFQEQLKQQTTDAEIQHKVLLKEFEIQRINTEKQYLQSERDKQVKELRQYGEQRVWLHNSWTTFEDLLVPIITPINSNPQLLSSFQSLKEYITLGEDNQILAKAPQQFLSILESLANEVLTDLEKQVAVLIHTGFSGKQMPALLHRSEAYLRQVRTRLKKKLDVPSSITLKTYLRTI